MASLRPLVATQLAGNLRGRRGRRHECSTIDRSPAPHAPASAGNHAAMTIGLGGQHGGWNRHRVVMLRLRRVGQPGTFASGLSNRAGRGTEAMKPKPGMKVLK